MAAAENDHLTHLWFPQQKHAPTTGGWQRR